MNKTLQELQAEIEMLKERVAYLERQAGLAAREKMSPDRLISLAAPRPAAADRMREQLSSVPQMARSAFLGMSEEKVAGTWFNRLGILAIMLGSAFFLKWSIDNDLIGELGRVTIGLTVGLGLIGGGDYFRKRNFALYGQGFTGGGISILYFSVFAAFVFYQLIPQAAAFGLMILITLAASLLAIRYDSRVIGLIGLVGGFATPFLLSSGDGNRIVLFTYIAILAVGVMLVAYYKRWALFNYVTFLFTYSSYIAGQAGSRRSYYASDFDGTAFLFLTVFFLLYLGVSLTRSLRQGEPFHRGDVSLTLANAFAYFVLSYSLIAHPFRDWTGFWAVMLGTVYLGLGLAVYRRFPSMKLQSLTLLAVAAGFLCIAVPLQLSGSWIPVAWAAEAVIVFYLSLKIRPDKVPVAGLAVLALALASLFLQPVYITGKEFWIFLNKGAVAHLAVMAAVTLMISLYSRHAMEIPVRFGAKLLRLLQIGLNVLIIYFFTLETNAYFHYRQWQAVRPEDIYALGNMENLILSLVWGLHAAILIGLGFWRKLRGIRLFGLGFMGVVIVKVFLYDLSHLSTPNRILSFMTLGVILLAVSWLYHRYKHQILGGGDDDEPR